MVKHEAPTANAEVDSSSMTANGQGSLSASSSSDPDGDVLNYRWQQTTGTKAIISNANSANAKFTVAQGTKAGETLTFQVTVTDPSGLSATATVSVDVENTPPVTNQDSASVESGKSIMINVLANDLDFNEDRLVLQSVSNPSGVGTASVVDGKIQYQAPQDQVTNVQLEYKPCRMGMVAWRLAQ